MVLHWLLTLAWRLAKGLTLVWWLASSLTLVWWLASSHHSLSHGLAAARGCW